MIFVGIDQVILFLIYTNQIRPYVCNCEKEICGPKIYFFMDLGCFVVWDSMHKHLNNGLFVLYGFK